MILDSYAADLLALLYDWLKAALMAEDLSGWVESSLVQTVRSIDIGTRLVDTPIVAISDADARSWLDIARAARVLDGTAPFLLVLTHIAVAGLWHVLVVTLGGPSHALLLR